MDPPLPKLIIIKIDEELETEPSGSFYVPFEDDLRQTIALLELNVDEVQAEVQPGLKSYEM